MTENQTPEAARTIAPRTVPAGRGTQWLVEGWEFFKRAPGPWIAIVVVFIVINVVAGLVPLVSILVSIAGPVFMGGFMLGCAALTRGEDLEVRHLFAGFSDHFGQLVLVGLLYLAAFVVIALIAGIILGLAGVDFAALAQSAAKVLLVLLIAMALAVPVLMAYWFAPALVVLNDCRAFEAMRASFVGCLRNIGPFLVYGLVSLILLILAMVPMGLGLLIFVPVLLASIYASYRDIFVAAR